MAFVQVYNWYYQTGSWILGDSSVGFFLLCYLTATHALPRLLVSNCYSCQCTATTTFKILWGIIRI